MLSTTQK